MIGQSLLPVGISLTDINHIGIKALLVCLLQPGWVFLPFLPVPLFIYKSCEVPSDI